MDRPVSTAERVANAVGYASVAFLMSFGIGLTVIIPCGMFDALPGERFELAGGVLVVVSAIAFLVGLWLGWRRQVPPLLLHLLILVAGGVIAAWSLIGWVSFFGSRPHWRGKVVTAIIVAATLAVFFFARRRAAR